MKTIMHSEVIFSAQIQSPLGLMRIDATSTTLIGVYFIGQRWEPPLMANAVNQSNPIIVATKAQLDEYFLGKRTVFDLTLAPRGTDFQQRVWRQIESIQSGDLLSYGEIAKRLGSPLASRAVGAATGKNPISIIIPCHRVVGASGQLTGYAGGLDRKTHLLRLESPQTCMLKI
jgi:methylated-DNA-[protein]-cysteine S-methyltransferase